MDQATLDRLVQLGLCLVPLCGPQCPGVHRSFSHPTDQSGKIPLEGGWQSKGYRSAEELLRVPGAVNFGVVTGEQPGAPLSVIVVDGDSPEALEWMWQHLPPTPWRVRTRQGEHWYYRAVPGAGNRNLRKSHGLSLDVRGGGGQVVAPGSTHHSGHVYEVVGEAWTAWGAATLPTYDPAWFPSALAPIGPPPGEAGAGTGGWAQPGGSWPGPRAFSRADYAEAAERALSYADRVPASVSGSDGHGAAYRAAVAILRGFPLCSWDRMSSMQAEDFLPVDAADAMGEALQILSCRFNPRCTAPDGQTPYPWSEAELRHKVEDAARADRLPGPDYWLFDDESVRARYAAARAMPGGVEEESVEPPEPVEEAPEGYQFMPALAREAEDLSEYESDDEGNLKLGPDGKPVWKIVKIRVTHDTEAMKALAIKSVGRIEGFYTKNDALIDMVTPRDLDRHGKPRRPFARRTSKAHLTSVLNSLAHWYTEKPGRGGDEDEEELREVRVRADVQTVSAVLAAGSWPGVRHLEGIVYSPVVKPSGAILQEPGYDYESRLYYYKTLDHGKIPDRNPSIRVPKAIEALMYVVKDVPFVHRHQRSAWLAAVLTRFARYVYRGSAPMFCVSATEIGSGKTLLCELASLISEGRPPDIIPFTGDPNEEKREILALLAGDETHTVCLDNVKIKLTGAAYEAMLTASAIAGREVGTSNVRRIVMGEVVWWATGNGLEIGNDMARRSLLMRIFDKSGKPTAREYSEKDIRAYVMRERENLVRACLFILSGFIAAKGPQYTTDCDGYPVENFASYEGWSGFVRQAVIWAGKIAMENGLAVGYKGAADGLPDPVRAMAGNDPEAATERSEAEMLVRLWRDAFGVGHVWVTPAYEAIRARGAKHRDLADHINECSDGAALKSAKGLTTFIKSRAGGVYTDKETGKKYQIRHGRAQGETRMSYALTESGD